jgi:uncharacterized repeat protein (TIGR01451 family)
MSTERYIHQMRVLKLLAWLLLGIAILLALNMHSRNQESSASAPPIPAWSLDSYAYQSNFSASDTAGCNLSETAYEAVCDTYTVTATNVGAEQSGGSSSVVLEDTVPAGVTVRKVSLLWSGLSEVPGRSEAEDLGEEHCTLKPVRCSLPATFFSSEAKRFVKPGDTLKMWITVTVNEPEAHGTLTNSAKVKGGGGAEVATSSQNTVGEVTPPFGFASFASSLLGAEGQPEAQAGAHPYALATQVNLNSVVRETPEGARGATTIRDLRDVIVDLPLGLAGSAVSAPTCTLHELASKGAKNEQGKSGCPLDSAIGHIRTYPTGFLSADSLLYNIVPEHGVAAEFGFVDNAGGTHVLYTSLAPTPSGYVLRSSTREVPQVPISQIEVLIYGDPAAHDRQAESGLPYATSPTDVSTFTNPESCSGEPLTTTIHMDSWFEPGPDNADGSPDFEDPRWSQAQSSSPAVSGCEALTGTFNPSVEAIAESPQADSPTGFDVNIKVPQSEAPEALGTPPLRDAVVALPQGVTVNPSSANGLEACSEAQVGISATGQPNAAAPDCPNGSKIGSVELETPALPAEACKQAGEGLSECPNASEREKTPLQGSIYVARQGENPFGSLLAIYIVIDDSRTGVIVKLAGEVKADESTGQLTTVVQNSPQFPFSELRTHFFAGDNASLRTPPTCGTYTVTSQLTPWSAPQSGPAASPSGSFAVSQSAGGGACAAQPNSPSFEASSSPAAGAFSPLLVHVARGDGSQNFSQISVTLPPGSSGKLAGIPQCSEAQIAAAQARSGLGQGAAELASPSCPAASAIGTVTVGAGAGAHPFYVTGNAYLAGPYKGAPFSAVFITPAIAGPFDLGVVLVRAALYINPATAQVTTASDPLPSILHGIPLDIRSLDVNVNRPGFTLNPTNCTPMSVTGEETSTLGQVAPLSSRFQVGGCAGLPFHPKLTASVAGKASKADGTSFTVFVSSAGLGQANIAKVDLTLPKALPSRLSTLQKACLAAAFEANPASCSPESVIGTATIHTPLLQSALSGPAYLVSHGSAAFPDVEFVLQGEGVELILDGKTDIKKGITYSRFESTPDAPFTSFEAKLPAGPHGVLTANVPESEHFSLCKQSLTVPTEIVGQNGAVIKQSTKLALTGCPKGKAQTRAQKLAKALKACKKDKKKAKRQSCERSARKRFGAKKAGKKKGKAGKKG